MPSLNQERSAPVRALEQAFQLGAISLLVVAATAMLVVEAHVRDDSAVIAAGEGNRLRSIAIGAIVLEVAIIIGLLARVKAKLARRIGQISECQHEILDRLAGAAEFRDDDTGQHTQRVGELSAKIAEALGLSDEQVDLLRRAAPLHDVGKIGIPDGILFKPGRLDEREVAIMRNHTLVGARMLGGGQSPLLRMAERIARSHHEKWDGTGYPDGVRGKQIPLEARIVAVADVFDALRSDRPQRKAWPLELVLDEIRRQRGRHFDPSVVDAFLDRCCYEERAAALRKKAS